MYPRKLILYILVVVSLFLLDNEVVADERKDYPKGLVGYSCSEGNIYSTTISLVQTPKCEEEFNKTSVKSVTVAVTQTASSGSLGFIRCKGIIDHLVTRCGKTLDQQYPGGLYSEIVRFSRQECRNLIDNGILHITSQYPSIVFGSPSGGKMVDSSVTWGEINVNGDCSHGPTLSVKGYTFDRPVRNSKIFVEYNQGSVRVDYDTKELLFSDGVKCDLGHGSCMGLNGDFLFWDIPKPTCEGNHKKKALVYKGEASLITTEIEGKTEEYIQVTQDGYDFQILLMSEIRICGRKSRSTEHPRLFVTLIDPVVDSFPIVDSVDPSDVNLALYVNSKLMYVLRHTGAEVMKLYRLFKLDRCKTQTRITNNMLTLAINNPKDFAYEYFGHPGYTAVTRGEVVHIAKCQPVAVIPQGQINGECYNELPVKYMNQTFFLTPRNRLLVSVGTKVECTPGIPALFLINSQWVTQTVGGFMPVKDPLIMMHDKIDYEFHHMKTLSSGGLYTNEVMDKLQKAFVSPVEQNIIISDLVSSMSGTQSMPDGYSLTNGFNHIDYKQIQGNVIGWLKKTQNTIWDVGQYISVITGYIIIFKLVVYLFDCILNYFNLKTEYKAITSFMFCWFSGLTNHLLLSKLRKERDSFECVSSKDNSQVIQMEPISELDREKYILEGM